MLKFRRSNTAANHNELLPPLPSKKERPPSGSSTNLDRKCSFVSSQLGHSHASILIRNLCLPLAWPVEEYFDTKKDWREFSVQLAIRSNQGGAQQFSKVIERINRTYTDVDFPDEFLFADQQPDFCIELSVFCVRSDKGAGASAGSMVQTISRSLGRSIGHSWRRYLEEQKEIDQKSKTMMALGEGGEENTGGAPNRSFLEELRRAGLREERRLHAVGNGPKNHLPPSSAPISPSTFNEHFARSNQQLMPPLSPNGMCPIGIARFRLRNATLSGKTHSYSLERLSASVDIQKSQLLPIYGNICAQILVQPSSLVSPLAQGSMDIFLSDAGILHQHLYCTLQGGQLRCWETTKKPITGDLNGNDYHQNTLADMAITKMPPLISFQISQNAHLEATAFPTAFRLIFDDVNGASNNGHRIIGQHLCICPTQRALIGWRNAIKLQKIDTEVWAEFALDQRNPHAAVLGELPGIGPPPFQHFTKMEKRNDESQKMATMAENAQNIKGMNVDGEIRPRACSSASVIVRNGDRSMINLNEEDNGKRRLAPASPSRTTLANAQEASPTLLSAPSSSISPHQSGLLRRRLTQQKANRNRGATTNVAEKHISWSLGHGSAGNVRPNARKLFQQAKIPPSMPQTPPSSNIASQRPLSSIEKTQTSPSNVKRMQQQKVEKVINMKESEEKQKTFILSLRIDPDEGKLIKNDAAMGNAVNSHHHSQQQQNSQKMPSIPGSPPPMVIKRVENVVGQQMTFPPSQRPFNFNLDFGGGQSPLPAAGRWARAKIGRSETWHFARTSQACTRL